MPGRLSALLFFTADPLLRTSARILEMATQAQKYAKSLGRAFLRFEKNSYVKALTSDF